LLGIKAIAVPVLGVSIYTANGEGIYTVTIADGTTVLLTALKNVIGLTVSVDGATVFATDGSSIWAVTVADGATAKLSDFNGVTLSNLHA
jgi:hypothetical protein